MTESTAIYIAFIALTLGISIGTLIGIAIMQTELKDVRQSLNKQQDLIKKMKG